MSSLVQASFVATGQVQSLDSVRTHALPSDALIFASPSLVTPTNQNTGSYALVESANALTLTTTGSVPVVTQSPFADLYKEGSLYFNGVTGNYVSATATGLAGTQWNTTGLTVEAWVNYPTFTGASVAYTLGLIEPTLVGLMSATGSGASSPFSNVSFGVNTTGNVLFWYSTTAVGQYTVTSYTQLSTNTWNHIAVSIAPAGFVYLFVNGVQSQIQENRNGTPIGAFFYGVVQGTPTATSSNPLVIGQFNQVAGTVYVADLRITTGAGIYTGSTSSYATFTAPSAPLSTAATGVTQALIRAGSNAPYVSNGALTFDRGVKQFMNFGPQTFNIVTQGFTAIVRFQFTGTVAAYERIIELGNYLVNGSIIIGRYDANQTVLWSVYPSNSTTAAFNQYLTTTFVQGTTYVLAFRYNPVTGIADSWVNGAPNQSTSVSSATLVADRIIATTYLGREGTDGRKTLSGSANVFAIYNRALSNVEIYNSYLALNTVPATPQQKTLEIGDINGTPALSVAGDGKVFMDSVGLTSNVVPWPPAAMTGYDTVINGGVYKARASTDIAGNLAWQAFDKISASQSQWASQGPIYSVTSPFGYPGTVTTTDVNGTVYPGEWVQLQLPTPVLLSSYIIYAGNSVTVAAGQMPSKFVVLGSRDGVNWTLVDSRSGVTSWAVFTGITFTVAATQSYSYYRVVGNQMTTGCNGYFTINEFILYGTADTSPTLTIAPATTFNTSVATPSLTGIAGDRFVPQDFSSSGLNIPAYVVSNTATTANTVAYSNFGPFAGEGSLYFPGGTGAQGAFVYFPPSTVPQLNFTLNASTCSIEFWFFPTKPGGAQTIISHAPFVAAAGYDWTMYIGTNNKLGFYAPAGGNPESAATVNYGAWNHAAFCFTGGNVYLSLNGVTTSAATAPTNTSTYVFVIGQERAAAGTYTFSGYISNFRVVQGQALYTTSFTPPTQSLQPIQGTTQAGLPYGTVLLLRNAPAPGRIQTTKFSGANSGQVLSFPPAAMTTYATSLNAGYGQGTYVASSSTDSGSASYGAWLAFDQVSTTNWASAGNLYGTSAPYGYLGSVSTIDVNGTAYLGEWCQIQLPSSLVLSSYAITSYATYAPNTFWVLGSRDGTYWNLVDSRSGISPWVDRVPQTFTASSSQAFTYFRLVQFRLSGNSGGGGNTAIVQLILNGSIESVNVTADGRLGVGVTNPARALEVAGDVVCAGTLSAGNPLMFRNALYNGDMRIAQRGTSFTNPSGQYTLDRWYLQAYGATGNGTVSQIQSGLANFSNALQLATTSTTVGNWMISQSLETRDVVRFQGQPVTVSFWYRIPVNFTNTWAPALYWTTSVDSAIYNGVAGSPNNAGGITIPNTTAWTYAQFQAFVPSTAQALSIIFSNYNNVVNGAQFRVTGVQLEKGSVATPFETRPFATELALCQRYYYQITALNNNGGSQSNINWGIAYVRSSGNASIYYSLPVPMRAQPTFFNSATLQFDWHAVANLGVFNSPVLNTTKSSNKDIEIDGTVTGGTQGQAGAIIFSAPTTGQYASFNAEL